MPSPDVSPQDDHVAETVEQLGHLYEQHFLNTSRLQRWANRATRVFSRPSSIAAIVALILAWVVGNYAAQATGSGALEAFPFPTLALIVTVAALVVALLILTTQRHQDDLAERRARLTLQIATLSEKKIAKLIELVEEQRRDNPQLPQRTDETAEAMSRPVDASGELDA